MRKGDPTLVAYTSPRRGEKVIYYSVVFSETDEVELMELVTTATPPPPPLSCGNRRRGAPNHRP